MSGYEYWPDECEECAYEGGGCSHDLRLWFHGPMTLAEYEAMLRFRSQMERNFRKVYEHRLESLVPDSARLLRLVTK